jgi:hypothetical protein
MNEYDESDANNVVIAEAVPVSTNSVEVSFIEGVSEAKLSFYENSQINEGLAREFLYAHGWPEGLQNFLIRNLSKMPYRFFICDDSGSMSSNDGMRMVRLGSKISVVKCTRW